MFLRPGGTVMGMLMVAAPVARSVWKDSLINGDIEPPIPPPGVALGTSPDNDIDAADVSAAAADIAFGSTCDFAANRLSCAAGTLLSSAAGAD